MTYKLQSETFRKSTRDEWVRTNARYSAAFTELTVWVGQVSKDKAALNRRTPPVFPIYEIRNHYMGLCKI